MIPEFTFKSKRLQPGPSISLKCMAGGRPEPKISWKFNGKNLTKDNKYVLREKKMAIGSVKSILVIKNVRSFDGGEYMCTASNEVGFVSFSETIDVYGPPLVHDMNNVTVAAGEDINIKCYTSGYPISSIEWIKEADPFYQSFANRVSRNKNLRINGTTEEDEGYYTCKSENGRGLSSDKRVFLNVIKKPEITPLAIPPTIMKAHSSYSIVCNIMSGDQPIKLYWLKDNDDISLVQKVYVTNTKKRYSLLQIQELSAVHSGVYSCVAENDAGKSVESVEIKISSPPRWLVQPTNIAASLNSEIMLDCMAEGFPQPQIKCQTIKVRFIQYITFDYNPSKKWRDVQMLSIKRWNGSGKSDYVGNKRYPTKRPTTVMKSKILEKIVRLDDASMSTNEAERTKNSASDQSSKQEIKKNMNLAESKSKEDKLDLKTLLIFVLPAIAVFVLLILLIVTLTAYLCTKKSNQKHRSGSLKMEYSGIDTLNRSGNWKKQDDGMGSMARRYGRLERPLPIAENTSDPTYLIKINMKFQIFTVTVLQNVISSDITGPIFITEPKPLSGFLNTQGAQLDCSAHGVPDPKIQWMRQNGLDELQPYTMNTFIPGNTGVLTCHIPPFYKDDLEVVSWIREDNLIIKPKLKRWPKTGQLLIENVSRNTNFKLGFWCQIRNRLTGETFLSQSAGRIKVTDNQGGVPPTISHISETVSINMGQEAELTCAGQGHPPPTYVWKSNSDGQVLSESRTLEIKDFSESGTFVYSCIVENKFGSDERKSRLIVRVLELIWKLNGRSLFDNESVKISKDILVISSANREHEGMYQCMVRNTWESIQTAAQVILGDMAPTFIQTFKSKKLQPGPSISLKCVSVGRPTPKITWNLNGKRLHNNNKFVLRETQMHNGTVVSSVVVKSIRSVDGGEYSCTAINKVDSVTHFKMLNIYGPPMVHDMDNITVAVGEVAVVKCYVSGYPISSIKWNKDLIFKTAKDIKGAAGPSSLDADGWRRILTSAAFGTKGRDLCDALARMTKKICSKRYCGEDGSLEALLACKLIPLDKNPGLRPIGVGEVLRRIMGRVVMQSFKKEIMLSAGNLQLCAGQRAGCKAVAHAMKEIFDEDECDAVLLVDADNAFNRINRKVMLHNICLVCPVIATYVINCYHVNARLFITGGTEITSQEGTTQGDPAAMPVYALATVPLLETLSTYDTKQAAYADDLVSAGKLKSLLAWWVGLLRVAPKAGYYPKPSKSWLIVKPEKYELAKMIFKNTNINITSQGQRHLGAAIGSVEFRKSFVQDKVNDWMHQLRILSKIACYYPQAAYCAFTAGFRQKFNYTLRTIPDIREYLHPIEEVIRHTFIPAICENRSCSDDERELLSLPVKMGGLGIPDITRTADLEHQASRSITHRLTMKIVHQNDPQDTFELEPLSTNITNKSEYHNQLIDSLREKMTPHELKANEIACSDGASIWLSSLPLKSEHFNLTKREFFDGIFLRYAWSLKHLPSECICKAKYSVDHALSFKIGGFVTLRHNEIRDLTADMLSTVCKDVHKEPCLQNVDNGVELRADVSARGFWQRMQRAFLDVRVFYPFAPSNRNQSLAASFRSMETVKKRKYNQRVINDENGTFTPLIFSSNGETKQILKKQKRILSNERVLRIPNVAEKNEGYYTCKAGNGRGLQSHKKLYINVIRKPQIARIYAPHNALKLGSTFSRLCSISNGDQPMNIYWLKDGLDASQITKVDVTNTKTYALLQVHDIGIEHKGNYTCVAENKAGKTYNSIKIDVAFSPKWTVQPTDVKVKLNSYGVFLKCEAEGFPSPTVKWHKHTYEGIIELLPFENKNIKHFENGTIKFSRIEANMEGNYSCLVSNGIEPDLIKLIKLKIIGFLEVMELTIQWKRSEGNIPKNSPRFTLLEKQDNLKHMSILKISRPINGEKFTCVASTKDFSEQKSILLSVEDVSVEESISTKAVEALFTQPPSAHVTKIIKLLGTKNSKKSGKLREQGDSSVALNDPILPKTLDHETPVNEENRNHLKVAGSRSKSNKTDLKTLLLFVLPAVAVFVLLILLIITLIAYLVTKRSNQRRKTENRRAECSGIDTLNKSHGKKSYSNMESLDRRYGKLERPLPTPGEDSEDNYQNPYEIPDYYAGMKSYSTLQHSGKHQPQTNSMPRMTVLQKAACSDITGPIFIKEPKPLAGFLNTQGAQLDCSAHGVPDPKIQWMRQNGLDELQPVKAVPPLMRIFSNGSMVIYDFDADQYRQDIHSTVYRCLASNIHGKIISSPVSVKATTKQQQQQLQAQVYDEYVIPGNTGVLTCHIPPFYKDDLEVVSWIREDNLIIKPKLKKNGLRMAENGQLLIENVSRNTNFKLGFWCQIRNRLTGETFLSQSAGRIKVTDNQGGVPPTISHISETVSINMGQEAELTCAGQGYPPPTYEWRLNSNEKILSESSTLEVDDFSESGTFVYSCILENKFGSDERKSRLIVREPLKAYILPNIQTVNSGDKIELKCVVNGHPVVELIWKFNGKSLFDSEKVKVLKNILVIPSANREHEGMYQCMVRNTWESIQTAAQVILGDMAPTFIQTFKSKKLQPGPSISLKCVSVGRPTPKITWNLHGKSLQNDNKFILREKQMHNGTVVSSVVVKNIRAVDGGEYSCIATNKVDSVTHSNTLDIYGPPMVHDMDNITVAVGENANVKCYVSGYPISSITWSKEIQQNYRKRGRKISNERILKIIKVNENDEGFYSCKATNGRGLNSKKRLYINVIRKPEIAQIYAPKKPSKIGSTFTKVCSVIDGDQPINIYWLKDGLDASLTGKVDVTNTKTYALLQIHEIEMEHSGNYTCVAENKAGKTHDSIKVNVAFSPKWTVRPSDANVNIDNDVLFKCEADGFPSPTIKWFKHTYDGDTELLPFENKNIKHFENGTIKITRVGENMEGNYSCLVSNGIKPDLMQFIKLKSIDPLKIYLVQLNEVNDTVRIECNVIGSNDVHIQWKHSKRFIPKNSSQRFTLTEKKDDLNHISILKIISPINGEKFTCVASTKNFSGQKSILLSVDGVIVEEMLSTKAVEAFYTQSPSIQVTKIMKPLDKNSKKSGKLQEQGDSSVALNGPILRKKPDYGPPAKEDIKTRLKVAESRSKTNNTDLKTLLLFVLPAVAVFVLLILLIVTLIAYLVTKRSNQRHETENRRAECSGIDTLNKSHGKKCYSNMESLDRRYGKLERPVPIPGEDSEDNYQNPYEIPDYSVLPKAFGSDITGPIFIKEPQSLPGFLNTHGAQLDCSAHGVPDPKVQWMRQNGMDELQPVKAVPPLMSIFANGSMIIYDFDADQYRQDIHSTVYRCLASNIHGKIISSPVSVKATTKQQQQQLQAQVYDEYVIPGNTGVLTCHIPPFYKDDLEVVSWIREDNLIIHPKLKKNGLRMAENGQLLIENVSRNTNVKLGFWCQIRNRLTGETFLSQSAGRIKVTDNQGGVPPTISHISETVSINMGQEAELTCAGQGYPPPTYAWKLNSNGKILSESPTLDIEDFSDSGTFVYSCIVANKFGSDERKSRLIVREPLKAYVLPNVQTVNSGDKIELKCVVNGHPVLELIWKFNGRSLFESEKKQMHNGTVVSSVVVKNIRAVDGGEYSCIATNKVDSVTHSNTLDIYGPPMVHDMDNITVAVGENANVKCYVSGYPISSITWSKEIQQIYRKRGRKISNERILKMPNVNEKDEGFYSCKATNGRGLNSKKRLYINVIRKPEIAGILTLRKPTKVGSTFTRVCSVIDGDQPINIYWLKDGLDASRTEKVDVTNTKTYALLQIHEIGTEHSGNYTCVAENKAGKTRDSIKVNVACTVAGTGQISFSWTCLFYRFSLTRLHFVARYWTDWLILLTSLPSRIVFSKILYKSYEFRAHPTYFQKHSFALNYIEDTKYQVVTSRFELIGSGNQLVKFYIIDYLSLKRYLIKSSSSSSSSSPARTGPLLSKGLLSRSAVLSIGSSFHSVPVKLSYIIHPPSLLFSPFSSSPICYPNCRFSGLSIVCLTGQVSGPVQLATLHYPLKISLVQLNEVNDTVRIECKVIGGNGVHIQWKHSKRIIPKNSHRYTLTEKGDDVKHMSILKIIRPINGEKFTCVASTKNFSEQKSILLSVEGVIVEGKNSKKSGKLREQGDSSVALNGPILRKKPDYGPPAKEGLLQMQRPASRSLVHFTSSTSSSLHPITDKLSYVFYLLYLRVCNFPGLGPLSWNYIPVKHDLCFTKITLPTLFITSKSQVYNQKLKLLKRLRAYMGRGNIKNQLKVAGSRSKASNTDLKTLLLFVLPAVAVFVLLILLIVTLIAYLVTKRSNQKHETVLTEKRGIQSDGNGLQLPINP
ncbi:Down syndrome cell adhesion molecule-like protein Dscam2 [Nymphon striatum]|nr:Down syndrome cell adhesion molecule-like protein Dscam2 [Nymphon striatum]